MTQTTAKVIIHPKHVLKAHIYIRHKQSGVVRNVGARSPRWWKAISTAATEQQDSTGEHKGRPATVHNVYDLRGLQEVVLRILRA